MQSSARSQPGPGSNFLVNSELQGIMLETMEELGDRQSTEISPEIIFGPFILCSRYSTLLSLLLFSINIPLARKGCVNKQTNIPSRHFGVTKFQVFSTMKYIIGLVHTMFNHVYLTLHLVTTHSLVQQAKISLKAMIQGNQNSMKVLQYSLISTYQYF